MMEDNAPRPEDRPTAAYIKENMLYVTLADGRAIATPLEWYPRLATATPEALAQYECTAAGIHWSELDEDLSITGMLQGNRPAQRKMSV